MNLLTPAQTVQLIKNGHRPHDDHAPVVFLREVCGPDTPQPLSILLTHVEPDHPKQAYGLVDFGVGKPRLTMIFLPQLESINPRHDLEVEPVSDFVAEYPISVYAQAARMMGKMTTDKAALQMAATHLELTKAKDKFVSPFNGFDGPAFLPMPN